MSETEFIQVVKEEMQAMDLIRLVELSNEYELMPIIGKIVGVYKETSGNQEKELQDVNK